MSLLAEWFDWFQALKGTLLYDSALCLVRPVFSRDALRIYLSLGAFAGIARLRRRGLHDWWSLAILSVAVIAMETLDYLFMARRGAAALGGWQLDALFDIANSLVLPALLVVLARRLSARSDA
jgi:hypothetical protein